MLVEQAAHNPRRPDAAGRDRRCRGLEYVHVCVDDATRLADVEVLGDEKATITVGFRRRAIAFDGRHGITVSAAMSDNGACYRFRAAARFSRCPRSDSGTTPSPGSRPGHSPRRNRIPAGPVPDRQSAFPRADLAALDRPALLPDRR